MAKYQKMKGTQDFWGKEAAALRALFATCAEVAEQFGYEEIITPTFEALDVFVRSGGDLSDVVRKEMYDFKDKGGRRLALRPEGTAGVIRAVIENKLYANNRLYNQYYYFEPMFRYDRPQAGRYREFYQFGTENFGPQAPLRVASNITLAARIFERLGLDVVVKINTLGKPADRVQYNAALVKYLTPHKAELCPDCQVRLAQNPLRILDCKVDGALLATGPALSDFVGAAALQYFEEVLALLAAAGVNYEASPQLVRGFDYYTDVVFEIELRSNPGLAIAAGGEYAGLVAQMGGPELAGCGFALGCERTLAELAQAGLTPPARALDTYILTVPGAESTYLLKVVNTVRNAGHSASYAYNAPSLKAQFKQAERLGAKLLLIIGESEAAAETVNCKFPGENRQEDVKLAALAEFLEKNLEE